MSEELFKKIMRLAHIELNRYKNALISYPDSHARNLKKLANFLHQSASLLIDDQEFILDNQEYTFRFYDRCYDTGTACLLASRKLSIDAEKSIDTLISCVESFLTTTEDTK